jgi:flavin reductase (DIM6/NTAB) family NADH-FMN oxidoreductase RutF
MTDDTTDSTSTDHDSGGAGALDTFAERIDPSAVIVTTTDGNEHAGCLIGFHCQSSIAPERYAVWLSKANHTFRVAMFADRLAVHLLSEDDRDLAELFATTTGDVVDKFTRCGWTPGTGGLPLLDRLPNRMIGRRVSMVDTADNDHVCLVLAPEVVETARPFVPLRISSITDLVPGHAAEERPVPHLLTDP